MSSSDPLNINNKIADMKNSAFVRQCKMSAPVPFGFWTIFLFTGRIRGRLTACKFLLIKRDSLEIWRILGQLEAIQVKCPATCQCVTILSAPSQPAIWFSFCASASGFALRMATISTLVVGARKETHLRGPLPYRSMVCADCHLKAKCPEDAFRRQGCL